LAANVLTPVVAMAVTVALLSQKTSRRAFQTGAHSLWAIPNLRRGDSRFIQTGSLRKALYSIHSTRDVIRAAEAEETKQRNGVSTVACDGRCISSIVEDIGWNEYIDAKARENSGK
jgi:hypothetical protein